MKVVDSSKQQYKWDVNFVRERLSHFRTKPGSSNVHQGSQGPAERKAPRLATISLTVLTLRNSLELRIPISG